MGNHPRKQIAPQFTTQLVTGQTFNSTLLIENQSNIVVSSNTFVNVSGISFAAIEIINSSNIVIQDNLFENFTLYPGSDGFAIRIRDSYNISIVDNRIHSPQGMFYGVAAYSSSQISASSNEIKDAEYDFVGVEYLQGNRGDGITIIASIPKTSISITSCPLSWQQVWSIQRLRAISWIS